MKHFPALVRRLLPVAIVIVTITGPALAQPDTSVQVIPAVKIYEKHHHIRIGFKTGYLGELLMMKKNNIPVMRTAFTTVISDQVTEFLISGLFTSDLIIKSTGEQQEDAGQRLAKLPYEIRDSLKSLMAYAGGNVRFRIVLNNAFPFSLDLSKYGADTTTFYNKAFIDSLCYPDTSLYHAFNWYSGKAGFLNHVLDSVLFVNRFRTDPDQPFGPGIVSQRFVDSMGQFYWSQSLVKTMRFQRKTFSCYTI